MKPIEVTPSDLKEWVQKVLSGGSTRIACGGYVVEKGFDHIQLSYPAAEMLAFAVNEQSTDYAQELVDQAQALNMGYEQTSGLFNKLTPEQQKDALEYRGPENFGVGQSTD